MTGAFRWHSTKAQKPVAAVATSMAARVGTGKTFTLPTASSGQKVFVQFDGVYMDSTVYLNGTQIGARPYGFSSFECDLGSNAKAGASNVLGSRSTTSSRAAAGTRGAASTVTPGSRP